MTKTAQLYAIIKYLCSEHWTNNSDKQTLCYNKISMFRTLEQNTTQLFVPSHVYAKNKTSMTI